MNIPSTQVPDQIKALQEKFPGWNFVLIGRKTKVTSKDDLTVQTNMDVITSAKVISEVSFSCTQSMLSVVSKFMDDGAKN